MDLLVEHVDVWAATIPDRPGGLADVLGILRDAGANLQSIISRRAPDDPGKGVVFVTGKSRPPRRSVSMSPIRCTRCG